MLTGLIEGKRVLVVEDRYLLADDLQRTLAGAGAQIIGPVSTVEAAQEALRQQELDGALLDIDIRGELAFSVAEELAAKGVPYIFISGFMPGALPERFREAPFLSKPASTNRVLQALEELFRGSAAK